MVVGFQSGHNLYLTSEVVSRSDSGKRDFAAFDNPHAQTLRPEDERVDREQKCGVLRWHRQVYFGVGTGQQRPAQRNPLTAVRSYSDRPAPSVQNLILPTGTAKIGSREYDVSIPNAAPQTIADLSRILIKTLGSTTIYVKDVAWVRDGFPPQTSIVRVNGQRSVLLTIRKAGDRNIDVRENIRGGAHDHHGPQNHDQDGDHHECVKPT